MNATISYDQIPQVLKDIPNWVLWIMQVRDDKETKMPISAHKQNGHFVEGKSNDSKTWADFSTVKDICEAEKDNRLGIGFVLGETEFAGVDIDDCRDPLTGRIEPWAQDIIDQLNSYTEVTPSKCGVRVWLKGKLTATHKKRFKMGPDKGEVEIYCRGRYFTCTGHHLENTPTEIMERSAELQKLHDDLSAKKRSEKQHENSTSLRSPEMSDEEILEHAKRAKNKDKFEALWNGDIKEYNNDDSAADMALVSLLSFWTQDPEQIDRLYRKSALMRDKWDEVHSGDGKLYSEMVIDKVLNGITEVYQASKKEKGTQAVRLFKMAMQEASFFSDSDGEFYAEIQNNGHQEIWSTGSGEFKRWLPHQFRLQENTFLNSTVIDQVIRELEYYASQTSKKVFTRVGGLDGDIYLDLCNEQWEAVKITKDGWSVINNPPVKFRRAKGMLPILPPEHSYVKLKDLHDYLNVKNPDDLKLVIGWLLGTLHPSGPYALLELAGESGSSKSTLTRFLRSITDPNRVAYKTFPKDEHDFAVAGKNCWIMAFDNISYLQDKLSDSLCRISTGEGLGTRKLYTDTDETIFWLKRPVIMNGITEVVSRGDLLDRMMLVELTPIPGEKRIEDSMMARKLEHNKGYPW